MEWILIIAGGFGIGLLLANLRRKNQQMQYLRDYSKSYNLRYCIVKACDDNRLDQLFVNLSCITPDMINAYVGEKITALFRQTMEDAERFVEPYYMIGALPIGISATINSYFMLAFQSLGVEFWGNRIFTLVVDHESNNGLAEIEATIKNIGDINYTREVYEIASSSLHAYVTMDLVSSDEEYKSRLESELKRLTNLAM